jgi:hypothetical protein
MLGWLSEAIARASRSKAGAELLVRGFDGDRAAQSRVYRKKHLAHAAFAQLVSDSIRPQGNSRGQSGAGRILQRSLGGMGGRQIQDCDAAGLRKPQFHFTAQFGIDSGQQCRTVAGACLASRIV